MLAYVIGIVLTITGLVMMWAFGPAVTGGVLLGWLVFVIGALTMCFKYTSPGASSGGYEIGDFGSIDSD